MKKTETTLIGGLIEREFPRFSGSPGSRVCRPRRLLALKCQRTNRHCVRRTSGKFGPEEDPTFNAVVRLITRPSAQRHESGCRTGKPNRVFRPVLQIQRRLIGWSAGSAL